MLFRSKKDRDLNFPQNRHRVNEFIPVGIRQVDSAKEKEHRLAEAQITRCNVLPHDDLYVSRLLQNEPELMSYQQFSAGSLYVAGPSSQHAGSTIYEEINSVGIWDFDSEEEEEQKQ